ncbi:hypothetical protein GQ55_4G305000 [Panicum hallii var. hallii]|uniref:Uncharacterized protein n=1 Tax=Panicum hallii var. hallii TaxID=1504633 RepID=A0A2T7E1T0_9POAL|nr:hypothetical protein GQ55_4G305000 [Panicum hallii var. hallii]
MPTWCSSSAGRHGRVFRDRPHLIFFRVNPSLPSPAASLQIRPPGRFGNRHLSGRSHHHRVLVCSTPRQRQTGASLQTSRSPPTGHHGERRFRRGLRGPVRRARRPRDLQLPRPPAGCGYRAMGASPAGRRQRARALGAAGRGGVAPHRRRAHLPPPEPRRRPRGRQADAGGLQLRPVRVGGRPPLLLLRAAGWWGGSRRASSRARSVGAARVARCGDGDVLLGDDDHHSCARPRRRRRRRWRRRRSGARGGPGARAHPHQDRARSGGGARLPHRNGSWPQVLKPSWARATTTGYDQYSLWGYPGIAIFREEFEYISIVNLVMCTYIQMNVVLNMVLVRWLFVTMVVESGVML